MQPKRKFKVSKLSFDEFISSLPDKFDTIIGENGMRLSGGETKIINSSCNAKEKFNYTSWWGNSSLDSETETKIQEALKTLTKGKLL